MVEKKNGVVPVSKKVAASVLAGIMATGMVPAAAFAEGTATDTSSDNDIELLSRTPVQAFSEATLYSGDHATKINVANSSFVINAGNAPIVGKVEFKAMDKANGDTRDLILTDNNDGTYKDDSTHPENRYAITYKNSAGEIVDAEKVKSTPDTYTVLLTATAGVYKGGVAKATFKVTGNDFAGVNIYNALNLDNSNPGDDQTFTYNAEPQKIVFKEGGPQGTVLTEGKDYQVKYFKRGADYNNPAEALPSAPTDYSEGGYVARVVGLGTHAGTNRNYDFTVGKLNLSSTDTKFEVTPSIVVGVDTPLSGNVKIVSVNGSTALASKVTIGSPWVATGVAGKPGRYSGTVNAVDAQSDNFAQDADHKVIPGHATVIKVSNAATINYNGVAMDGQSVTIDKSKGQTWTPALIKAYDSDGNELTLEPLIYKQEDGTNVGAPTNGTYTVIARVKADAPGAGHEEYSYGGEAKLTLKIVESSINADTSATVSFDGVVTNAISTPYTGQNIIPRIKYSIFKGNTQIPASDYKVVFTDSKGNTVNTIKDAGTYTLTFQSDKYQIDNPTVSITISPRKILAIRVDPTKTSSLGNGQIGVLPTTNLTAANIEFDDGTKDGHGDISWKPVSSLSDLAVTFTNSSGQTVSTLSKVGVYTATVTDKNSNSGNFDITAPVLTINVSRALGTGDFSDVVNPNTPGMTLQEKNLLPWYNVEVYKAKDLGYMHGYIDDPNNPITGTMFRPEQSITRAEFARVLYNMAGNPAKYKPNETENGSDKDVTNTTNFSDCDDSAWYARAVAWAHATGIVTGYGDTGLYKPNQAISRQEVAVMVSRYARYMSSASYKSGDQTNLGTYLDSFMVDDWASSAVKWAVANKVMGVNTNLLSPRNSITRAEVAAMSVRTQPHKIV